MTDIGEENTMNDTQGDNTQDCDPLQSNDMIAEALHVVSGDAQAVLNEALAVEVQAQHLQNEVVAYTNTHAASWSTGAATVENETRAWESEVADFKAKQAAVMAARISPNETSNDDADDSPNSSDQAQPSKSSD